MSLDSGRADIQQVGDFLVGPPLGSHLQNFTLAIREQVVAVLKATLLQAANIVFLEDSGDLAGQEGTALRHRASRLHHLAADRILKKVPFRTGLRSRIAS